MTLARTRVLAVVAAAAVALSGLALVGDARATDEAAPTEQGGVVEEPVFVDLAGKEAKVSQHLGKILVVNFWATWCGPCRAELPALAKIQEQFASQGVHVLGISANGRDDGPAVTALFDQLGVKLDTWLWATAKDMRHWGVGPGIPATIVLDGKGVIRATFRGTVTQEQLRPVLTKLVAETQTGAPGK